VTTVFYRNVRYFVLAVALIISAGVSSALTIGRQEDPTITNLFATIVTPYPGATPARVEALITEKIEEELREIEEIDEISSTSRTGVSVVSVQLSEYISEAEIERTWSEIRDALSAAELLFPPTAGKSDFDKDRTGAYTSLSAITARPGVNVSLGVLKRYAERLQERMRAVPGTELVRLFGDQDEELLVTVDASKLTALGLTVDDVANAITQADSKVQAGRVRGMTSDYLIEVGGEIESLDRVRSVPLVSADSGEIIRVGDVSTVTRGVQMPASAIAYADGVPAVIVASKMQPDLQVDAWAANADAAMTSFEADLPGGLEHTVLFNQARYTADRLTGLGINMLNCTIFPRRRPRSVLRSGESAPAFYYNMIQDQDGVPSFAEALVSTASQKATRRLVPELQVNFDRALPEAQVLVRDLVQGPPVSAPLEVRLVGPDTATLRTYGEQLRRRIADHPSVTHTKASLSGGAPKYVFDLDEDKVRASGLTLSGVARQLQSSIEGATGGSLLEGTEDAYRRPGPCNNRADRRSQYRGAWRHVDRVGRCPTRSVWFSAFGAV